MCYKLHQPTSSLYIVNISEKVFVYVCSHNAFWMLYNTLWTPVHIYKCGFAEFSFRMSVPFSIPLRLRALEGFLAPDYFLAFCSIRVCSASIIQRFKKFKCKHVLYQTKLTMSPANPCGLGLPTLSSVVPGRGAGSCCHHHGLFLLLPRGKEFSNHGLLQENGATGKLICFGVWCSLTAFGINKPSLKWGLHTYLTGNLISLHKGRINVRANFGLWECLPNPPPPVLSTSSTSIT